MTQHIAAAGIIIAALYCAYRAVHWYEAAPVMHDSSPYWRCIAWGVLSAALLCSLHTLWEVTK